MRISLLILLLLVVSQLAYAQEYKTPDPRLAQLVDQPTSPGAPRVSPDRKWICFLRRPGLDSIADLAGPELNWPVSGLTRTDTRRAAPATAMIN